MNHTRTGNRITAKLAACAIAAAVLLTTVTASAETGVTNTCTTNYVRQKAASVRAEAAEVVRLALHPQSHPKHWKEAWLELVADITIYLSLCEDPARIEALCPFCMDSSLEVNELTGIGQLVAWFTQLERKQHIFNPKRYARQALKGLKAPAVPSFVFAKR